MAESNRRRLRLYSTGYHSGVVWDEVAALPSRVVQPEVSNI